VAPRSKPKAGEPSPSTIDEILTKALGNVTTALERAQTNGAQGARATIESQNNTVRALEAALKGAYDQIGRYEQVVQHMLGRHGELMRQQAEATKIDSDERIKLVELQHKAAFNLELVHALGPAASPAVLVLLRKCGLVPDDSAMLNASGSDVEIDRGAFWATINTITTRPDLQATLSEAVGAEQWSRTLQHLQREYMAAQAKTAEGYAKTNGVSN
jgi:hypothetical protein